MITSRLLPNEPTELLCMSGNVVYLNVAYRSVLRWRKWQVAFYSWLDGIIERSAFPPDWENRIFEGELWQYTNDLQLSMKVSLWNSLHGINQPVNHRAVSFHAYRRGFYRCMLTTRSFCVCFRWELIGFPNGAKWELYDYVFLGKVYFVLMTCLEF